MGVIGEISDGISSAVKAMVGELAQETSQVKAGSLTGLFKKGGWGNVMGEASDLSKIAVRQDYAQEALNLIHGSTGYKGLKGDALTKMDDALDDAFKRFVRGQSDTLGTIGDEVSKAISAGGNEAYDKVIKNFNDIQSKYDIAAKLGTGDDMYKSYFGKESGFFSKAGAYYKDPVYGSNRISATAGAVVAGGIGIRYLQGGSLTRKANGENDIAGIPFI